MDHFHFGSPTTPNTKTEDQIVDIPFNAFDDDLDHRKRRRNRTTQSCWSCHQAKRKCDRKRPCSRCIQLGLTGLCVYETDDPASRDDPTLSETQRLRKRIAELEALVREMKNKPHPRWADKVNGIGHTPGGVDKWHTRAKYVNSVNSPTTPASATSAGGANGVQPMEFDDYQYRFPPLEGSGAYDAGFAAQSAANAFDEQRRLSITSSVSSTSSPRTPYYLHSASSHSHPHHLSHISPSLSSPSGSGSIVNNPCNCLATSPPTARALANQIRTIVLESGMAHPYSEACRVLALVRELETVAEAGPSSSSATNGTSSPWTNGATNGSDHHNNSGANSPHPPSSSASNSPPSSLSQSLPHVPSLPMPLQLPILPSSSANGVNGSSTRTSPGAPSSSSSSGYGSYPSLSTLSMASFHHSQSQSHSHSHSSHHGHGGGHGGPYASPPSDDDLPLPGPHISHTSQSHTSHPHSSHQQQQHHSSLPTHISHSHSYHHHAHPHHVSMATGGGGYDFGVSDSPYSTSSTPAPGSVSSASSNTTPATGPSKLFPLSVV